MSIALPLSEADLLDLREEVASPRGLVLSHRFRGEMERANREEGGNRESNDDPLDELWRAESRPLAKLGNPTFRSSPDIIAVIEFLPFCCAEVGEEGEEGLEFLVVAARLRVSESGPLASAKIVSMCRRSPGGVVFVLTPDCSILLTEFLFAWGRSVPSDDLRGAVSESLGDFSLSNSTAGGDDDDEVAEELRRKGEDEIGSFQLRR